MNNALDPTVVRCHASCDGVYFWSETMDLSALTG